MEIQMVRACVCLPKRKKRNRQGVGKGLNKKKVKRAKRGSTVFVTGKTLCTTRQITSLVIYPHLAFTNQSASHGNRCKFRTVAFKQRINGMILWHFHKNISTARWVITV